MRDMLLSFFPHEGSAVATQRDLSKDELVKTLSFFYEREAKSGLAWSPAELRPCDTPCHNTRYAKRRCCVGGQPHRLERNVLRHHAVVFDIDHASEETAESIIRTIQAAGLECVVHSTHSHTPPADCCLRVVLFPSRPIEANEVRGVRDELVKALKIPVDPATKDLSRLYYLPAHKPGAAPFALHLPGGVFDVADLVAKAGPTRAVAESEEPPATVELADSEPVPVDIEALRNDLRRIPSDEGKELARIVLAGEPIAAPGARDATLNRLAALCATWLPEGTPFPAVLHLCESSIRGMPGDEGFDYWADEFRDMYERAVERTLEYRAEKKAESDALLAAYRKTLAQTVANPLAAEAGEDGKYTEAALAEWKIGDREWIIQYRETFFIFAEGEYIGRARSEVPNCYKRDLIRAPIELTIPNRKGERDMTFGEVMDAYGTVAKSIESSLVLQRSYYDPVTGIFHEAVCPRRYIEPKEHPEIQKWLEVFGGEDANRLLDWIATVTRTDRQTCALYLYGPGGTGKTLLPQGLARLWSTGGPADLRLVMGSFNDVLTKCPLIFADESLPPSRTISEDLRELIGSTVRPLTRKYMAPSGLTGAIRLIMAGNNPDLLRPQGDMSEFDLEAVAERFLFVEVPLAAREYLLELGGPKVVNDWIYKDKIAEHALWLAETRSIKEAGRFLVTGQRKRFHERLAVNSGVGSGVCEVLAKVISSKKPIPPAVKDMLLVGTGEVFVNVNAIEILWPEQVKSADVPGMQRLAKALKAISHEVVKVRVNGTQRNYARVRIDQLVAWAEENGVADGETLRARIDEKIDVITEIMQRRDPIRTRKPRAEGEPEQEAA